MNKEVNVNRPDIAKTFGPLVAIPVIVIILLNIVGGNGIGMFDDRSAVLAVIVCAIAAIVVLQALQSSNKVRTVTIHVVAIGVYTCLVLANERYEESSGATGYFRFNIVDKFTMLAILHSIVSYIVLATRTYALRTIDATPAVKTPVAVELPKSRLLNIGLLIVIAAIECTIFFVVIAKYTMGDTYNPEMVMTLISLLLATVNVVLLGVFTKNWKRTLRIHGILVGVCIVLAAVSVSSTFGYGSSSSEETFPIILVPISMVYALVSYVVLGIGMYLTSLDKSAS